MKVPNMLSAAQSRGVPSIQGSPHAHSAGPHAHAELVKKHNLCLRCLGVRHSGCDCRQSKECGLDGCRSSHSCMLHIETQSATTQSSTVTQAAPVLSATASADTPTSYYFSRFRVPQREAKCLDNFNVSVRRAHCINHDSSSFKEPNWPGKGCHQCVAGDSSTQSHLDESVAGQLGLSA